MNPLPACCQSAHALGRHCPNHGRLPGMLVSGVDVPPTPDFPAGTLIAPPDFPIGTSSLPSDFLAADTAPQPVDLPAGMCTDLWGDLALLDPRELAVRGQLLTVEGRIALLAEAVRYETNVARDRGQHGVYDRLREVESQIAVLYDLVDKARVAQQQET